MSGHQPPAPRALPPPRALPAPREAWDRPTRIELLPGTPYGLVIYGMPRTMAGQAVASLVAGIAGLVVALVVACFGLVAASEAGAAWFGGAFAVLAAFLGGAGLWLGLVALRRTRRTHPRAAPTGAVAGGPDAVAGRGLAISGLVCGACALGITVFAMLGAILLALA